MANLAFRRTGKHGNQRSLIGDGGGSDVDAAVAILRWRDEDNGCFKPQQQAKN
eukprot:CAMPEP_0113559658 /NCGR_PEP_ID=MMETSP0015_2-20120614/19015_1 /TAXON_ID=2838 /ORGANISM="Odontella" /LENGTH=52 /DNA_ID=CAMNT_0000461311 /DNA_START=816 /DNA_END=974 /DNA_ORIENTATION=- /assembly_acc=CAM_ASM_000160